MSRRHKQEVLQEGRPLGVLWTAALFSLSRSTAASISIATIAITTTAVAITAAASTEHRRLDAHGRQHQRVRGI